MTQHQPGAPGQWQTPCEAPRRQAWSWRSFAVGIVAGIVTGAIGLFGLGAILFEDDIAADLEAERATNSGPQVTRAESIFDEAQEAIESTQQCNGVVCVGLNEVRLDDIESSLVAVMPRQASIDLSLAYGEWYRANRVWSSQWCNQETNETCDQAQQDMNQALAAMKAMMPSN